LIDDVDADLRQPENVRLARTKIPALHRVIKKAVNAVAVIPVIFRGVDAALRGDRVRAARAVLEAEAMHVITLLPERRRCRSTREPRAHDDDRVLAAVRGIDELHFKAGPFPLVFD
jgi:hypothetical protein